MANHQKPKRLRPNSLFSSDFRPKKGRKSELKQIFIAKVAYHWEIGRETTAIARVAGAERIAYHWEIGRETTAWATGYDYIWRAYHWEIGRETTAIEPAAISAAEAYHWEIGRETTAPRRSIPRSG